MAEFSETMRNWARMCNYYGDSCGEAPSRCPLANMHGICEAIYDPPSSGVEWESIERIINEWHEPVYPTWTEYLSSNGFLRYVPETETYYDFTRLFQPIPADIAQKLGIKPKEDIC